LADLRSAGRREFCGHRQYGQIAAIKRRSPGTRSWSTRTRDDPAIDYARASFRLFARGSRTAFSYS